MQTRCGIGREALEQMDWWKARGNDAPSLYPTDVGKIGHVTGGHTFERGLTFEEGIWLLDLSCPGDPAASTRFEEPSNAGNVADPVE